MALARETTTDSLLGLREEEQPPHVLPGSSPCQHRRPQRSAGGPARLLL